MKKTSKKTVRSPEKAENGKNIIYAYVKVSDKLWFK